MSTWDKISCLPLAHQSKIIHFYRQYNFPIEIRSRLSVWLEQQNWPLVEAALNYQRNNGHDQYGDQTVAQQIDQVVHAFVEELRKLLEQNNEVPFKFQLHNLMQQLTSPNGLTVIRSIVECLKYELNVLDKLGQGNVHSSGGDGGSGQDNVGMEFEDKLEHADNQLKVKLKTAEELVRKIKATVEDINIKGSQLSRMTQYQNQIQAGTVPMPSQQQKNDLEANKSALYNEVKRTIVPVYSQYRDDFFRLLNELIVDLEGTFNSIVLTQLHNWKQRQLGFVSGFVTGSDAFYDNIMQIKEMCEQYTVQIRTVLLCIKNVEMLLLGCCFKEEQSLEALKVIKAKVVELLQRLVNETFVIKQQPRQVIKKDTKFVATLTLLISGVLNVPLNPPTVKVSIINEMQAKQLHLNPSCPEVENCGEILNNTSVMENSDTTRLFVANFANLQLKRIKRNEKKGSESVMDEKFGLLFTTDFFIDPDLKIHAKVLSVPVVVIVHGNQEANAQATITWDNAFAAPTRCPFEVPQEVRFDRLAPVLSQKFCEVAGRPLSEENLHFLACKLQGKFDITDPYNTVISWPRFCKDHLHGQTFTFWDWFYAIFKLTRDHLVDLWRDGYINGFLTRARAEELLLDKNAGTFLLRFSDTKLGSISVASININREIYMVDPYMAKDLLIRKLADRLHDIEELKFLYPDRPKDEVFGQYYTKENQLRNGYVRPLLRNYLPSLNSTETNSTSSSGGMMVSGQGMSGSTMAATPSSARSNSVVDLMPMSNEYLEFDGSLMLDSSDDLFDLDQFNN